MAMLEAFVYDPMISWRVLAQANTAPNPQTKEEPSTSLVQKSGSPAPMSQLSHSHSPIDILRSDLGIMIDTETGLVDRDNADEHLLGLEGDAMGSIELCDQEDAGDILGDDSRRSPRPDDAHGSLKHGLFGLEGGMEGGVPYVPSTMLDKRVRQNPNPEVDLAEPDEPMRENINARYVHTISLSLRFPIV